MATDDPTFLAMHRRHARLLLSAYAEANGTPPAAELERFTPHEQSAAAAAWEKASRLRPVE